jgi:hypothetical protein
MMPPRLTGSRCQCPTCGDYFGSVRGFDRHRIGAIGSPERRCLSAVELLHAGWRRTARGFLLTPDARRAGASISSPCEPPPATGVQGVMP